MSQWKSCQHCGRETKAERGVCGTCLGGVSNRARMRGRKHKFKDSGEIEFIEGMGRDRTEGWFYSDYDKEY